MSLISHKTSIFHYIFTNILYVDKPLQNEEILKSSLPENLKTFDL